MEHTDWTFRSKPYDLRERLFNFAVMVTRLVQFLQRREPVARVVCGQILRSGTSAAANYEEADDGSSSRDCLAKRKIVLRELKETSVRLRILRTVDILTATHDSVIVENGELIKIVATIIRNSPRPGK